MKKLFILSDTHYRLGSFSAEMRGIFDRYDLIIHAGDYVSENTADELEMLGNFTGVSGNSDSWALRERLGKMKIIEVEGKRIGVCHGDGHRIVPFENARQLFTGKAVDAVIYGHSHIPDIKYEGGVLYINPGSAGRPRGGSGRSAAELIVGDGKFKAGLIKLKE